MAKPKDRIVRVVTVTQDGLRTNNPADRVAKTLERMNPVAVLRPDIVCIPECFTLGEAEPVMGPSTEPIAAWAKKHNTNVICPLLTLEDGREFNSAVVFDRGGQIVGIYHKVHLTRGALGKGCPGTVDAPVFKLDCATIGIQICFDVNWRQTWRGLAAKGAEILFWPTAFPAKRRLSALAWMLERYTISSTIGRMAHIYDISGDILASTGTFQPWAMADLNLGKRLFEIDFQLDKAAAIRAKYGNQVQINWFHEEDWWTLASKDPKVSTAEIIDEFGLVPFYDYIPAATKENDDARAKLPKKLQ